MAPIRWGDSNNEHFHFLCALFVDNPMRALHWLYTSECAQLQINRSWFECPDYRRSVSVSLKQIQYDRFFFILSIKSMQCTESVARLKNTCDSNFSSPCSDVPKMWNLGDWEWLWSRFRTFTFLVNRFLSHFLIVS